MLQHIDDFVMSVPYGTIRGKIWRHSEHSPIDDETIRILGIIYIVYIVCIYYLYYLYPIILLI